MLKAIVESISKESIIVKAGNDVLTLTGAAVLAIAPTLKLGNEVEFDKVENLSTIRILPTQAASSPKKSGSSPAMNIDKIADVRGKTAKQANW